jgi:pimeloyl-ACP methyl ester carboxylesterase
MRQHLLHSFGALSCLFAGCTWMTEFGSSSEGAEHGKTFFVGGAGSIGAVAGTFDVPAGLRKGGYRGAIEVFGWQAYLGDALRDQVDRERNIQEAQRLAERIAAYMQERPGRPVNLIALSAGTGVATWALESLPAGRRVERVVFLSSSMSRDYDLTTALLRVRSGLFNFFSPKDPLLAVLMRSVGTVDRGTWVGEAAGLSGFAEPPGASPQSRSLYQALVRNIGYREEWSRYGYFGLHADSVAEEFIREVVAPVVMAGREPGDWDVTSPRIDDGEPLDPPPPRPRARSSNLDVRVE